MTGEKVAVAMSGGVDSSVAAAILIDQGYDVVGVTLRMWSYEQGSGNRFLQEAKAEGSSPYFQERIAWKPENEAAKVASKLGIPHFVLDAREEFSHCVIDNFIQEYRQGRTPNPCVRCNPEIKFNILLRYAEEQLGAAKLATGHYARVERDESSGKWRLLRGLDPEKDQSYVLYRLTQDQLSKTLLPLGYYTKDQTRDVAQRFGIDFRVSESQDICFIPEGSYRSFLAKVAPDLMQPGLIVDTSGNVIGKHNGIAFYTVGQRRGLGVAAGKRLYVVAIDAKNNRIVVGQADELERKTVIVKQVNLISGEQLAQPIVVSAKIRYNTQDSPAVLRPLEDETGCVYGWAKLDFERPQRAVAPGQSAVFYVGDEVLGGGIIADDTEIELLKTKRQSKITL